MDLLDAPLLERHRGLAAAGLNLLEQTPPPSSVEDMEILSTLVSMLKDLENGDDYFGKQCNSLWGYYFCKADGTGQRFSMMIPRDLDSGLLYPMFVNLHGNGGRPLPSTAASRQSDYFQIRPWGRGDISYFGLGEVDVLEAMRHVLKWYLIDPDRICLGGHSMGGNATWDLASRHTNLFACLVPKAGRSGDGYYENFRHVPSLIQHGALDSSQPVDFGRYTVSRLQQLGFPVIYKEFPEDGHGIRDPYPVEEWFINQRRPNSPEKITYSCDTVKTGQIYWAAIHRFTDPHHQATLDAHVVKTGERQTIKLELKNIEVIELNLDDVPTDKSKSLHVLAGADEFEITAPLKGKATLMWKDGAWQQVDEWMPPSTGIRPYMPGGAGNLYSGEPLLIIYPTEGIETTRRTLETAARSLVLFGGFGGDMITGRVPIKADKDVTESDLQHRNLILVGGPKFNTVTRRMVDDLPIKTNAASQFVIPGHDPFDVGKSSLLLTTFSPFSPKQLVHIIWQDEIPPETSERFVRQFQYRLPGASGRYPHNIPDLQITSPELTGPIRRQFTYGWTWKEGVDVDIPRLKQVQKEGVDIVKLRLMQTKAEADFAIGFGTGSWGNTSSEPSSLEQFRYQNYRMTTFKANLTGKDLKTLFAESEPSFVISYPSIRSAVLQPDRKYSIVAPEAILWTVKPIRNYWTEMVAGPDIEKFDIIEAVYGVTE